MIRGSNSFLATGCPGKGVAHVGLTGAQPDFAYQDVGEGDGFAAGSDGQFSGRGVGGQGIELNLPFALLIGLRGFGLVGEPDLYRSSWCSLSPNGCRHIALKYTMIGKDFRDT